MTHEWDERDSPHPVLRKKKRGWCGGQKNRMAIKRLHPPPTPTLMTMIVRLILPLSHSAHLIFSQKCSSCWWLPATSSPKEILNMNRREEEKKMKVCPSFISWRIIMWSSYLKFTDTSNESFFTKREEFQEWKNGQALIRKDRQEDHPHQELRRKGSQA